MLALVFSRLQCRVDACQSAYYSDHTALLSFFPLECWPSEQALVTNGLYRLFFFHCVFTLGLSHQRHTPSTKQHYLRTSWIANTPRCHFGGKTKGPSLFCNFFLSGNAIGWSDNGPLFFGLASITIPLAPSVLFRVCVRRNAEKDGVVLIVRHPTFKSMLNKNNQPTKVEPMGMPRSLYLPCPNGKRSMPVCQCVHAFYINNSAWHDLLFYCVSDQELPPPAPVSRYGAHVREESHDVLPNEPFEPSLRRWEYVG